MVLTAVESSHVAAIGYLETERVLLVRYKDGSLYAWQDIGPTEWRILTTPGQSVGTWLAGLRRKHNGVLITKGGGSESDQRTGPASSGAAGPLNVIDENADKCCRKMFAKLYTDEGPRPCTCPDCGTMFNPQMVGPVRHWRIVEYFAIARPR